MLPLFAPMPLFADEANSPEKHIWLWSDAHISRDVGGKDGSAWLQMAIDDTVKALPQPAYTLVLGDLTHGGSEEHLAAYAGIRSKAQTKHKMKPWYEIVGNHDWKGVEAGHYAKLVRPERSYCLEDGNLLWILISAERAWSRGIISGKKQAWMEKIIGANQDKNIIVCSHQTVANTVRYTNPKGKYDIGRILQPVDWIRKLLRKYRIDAWLSGHEHRSRRDHNMIRRVGHTTFINIASVSHVYNTKASHSFMMTLSPGAREIKARCREHDTQRFLQQRFSTTIPMRFPLKPAGKEKMTKVLAEG